jgi:hypothetical protein
LDLAACAATAVALRCRHNKQQTNGLCTRRLPEKVAADREGLLVAFAYSEIGVLNNVVELWRYPSAAACLR